ncbi:MAG: helix-turn-helix transcriptional regulator [Pyrinomonadaceae bacterium]
MGQRQRPRPKRLAAKLRQIRAQLDLTQEQMAERLKGIESPPQPGHISEFESGRREPSLLFLLGVARLAGVMMELLVDDEVDLPAKLPRGEKRVSKANRQR